MKDQDTSAVITAIKDLHQPKVIEAEHDGVKASVLVFPNGMTARAATEFTEKLLPKPRRKTGNITATSHESFNEMVKTHAEPSSVVFVNGETGAFNAVLNFHGKGADDQRHGDLRVGYAPKKSKAWMQWTGDRSDTFLQVSIFADFIDANILDICEPPPADSTDEADIRMRDLAKAFSTTFADKAKLIELSRGLRVHTSDNVETVINTNTGEMSIEFKSEHKARDGKRLEVPGLFCIAIPVFEQGVVYRLPVRFKYRANGGAVMFSFTVLNADKAIDHAISEMVGKTKEATSLPVYFGAP